jgi:hypothetical protein
MALVSVSGKFGGPRIASIVLDATLTEQHEREAETTDSPVESGAAITDHIRIKPNVLTLEGIVSDTPLMKPEDLDREGIDASPKGLGRSELALEALEELFKKRELISVFTKVSTYTSMVITKLSIPRAANIGDALRFSATFKEIHIAETTRAKILVKRTAKPSLKPKDKGGQQAPKPVYHHEETKSSFLFDVGQKLKLISENSKGGLPF